MVAVSCGVWVAYRQLHAWRDQDLLKKKADVAEELLAAALEISDTLKALRTPIDSIPINEQENRSYAYQKRLDRFKDAAPKFETLRRLQIRASAILGSKSVNEVVNTLFQVRQSTIVAIQVLHDRPEVYGDVDQNTRDMYQQMQRDMWGTYSEKYDPLGMKQLRAIETLENQLTPFVQYRQPVGDQK